MKMTFRWYGESDPVKLAYIRQIPGMYGIVSAVYDVPVGEVWPIASLVALRARIEAAGLKFEVVESVPVHEDIKLGKPGRDRYIENFKQNIRHCAAAGVKVICYNFMPVFDWTRTEMAKVLPDGSTTLAFDAEQVAAIDPEQGISLPGWDASYRPEQLKACSTNTKTWTKTLVAQSRILSESDHPGGGRGWCAHGDAPRRPTAPDIRLPRIVKNHDDLQRLVDIVDSPSNGLTLCSGSLGADLCNNIPALVRKFGGMGRIHFAHIRNVSVQPDGTFYESSHLSCEGSLDLAEIVKAYHDVGGEVYVRPDHGRMIWGESGKPGYGLYDRALGAVYINGLWEAVSKYAARSQGMPGAA